VISINQSEKLV
jgi:hypothetical protein